MSVSSGRSVVDGADRPPGLQAHAPGDHEFVCLGGMDLLSDSPVRRWLRSAFPWFLALGPIALIVLLLFVPFPIRSRLRANELAAIQMVRAVRQAEEEYRASYPTIGYACDFASLGGDPSAGPPGPRSAQILNIDPEKDERSGYFFTIEHCTNDPTHHTDRVIAYTLVAVPQVVGKAGKRGFCADQSGNFSVDPDGGTNCTQEFF
jgi:hypothetical protein